MHSLSFNFDGNPFALSFWSHITLGAGPSPWGVILPFIGELTVFFNQNLRIGRLQVQILPDAQPESHAWRRLVRVLKAGTTQEEHH
jgi:hypothetical protein